MTFIWLLQHVGSKGYYLLQVVYMAFHYLTVLGIPTAGHVYDNSLSDSFGNTDCRSCKWHFTTWQFCVYQLQVMYVAFHYLTVLCIPTAGHVNDIPLPLSFVYSYRLQVMYVAFHYLTVLCIPTAGHVNDISLPNSFVYTDCRPCMWHFTSNNCYLGMIFFLAYFLYLSS